MSDTRDADVKKTNLRDTSFNLTDGISRVVRAGTEAATEASVGAVRVATGIVAGIAQSVADNVNRAVADSTPVAQRSVDKFLSILDGSRGADQSASAEAGSAPNAPPKKTA
jgi:hypothetical protein